MDYSELLDATIDHLEERHARGQRFVEVSAESLAALEQPLPSAQSISRPAAAPSQNRQPGRPTSDQPVQEQVPAQRQAPRTERPRELIGQDRSRPLSRDDKDSVMADLCDRAMQCVKCGHLVKSRKNVVFGVGDIHSELMFVGEAPGMDEDRKGEPFVGKAGQLLSKIIQTMGLERDAIYICNVVKCRPDTPGQRHGNRKPTPTEMMTCLPYLQAQIEIIRPKVIVCLGGTAVEGLFGKAQMGIMRLRGTWMTFREIPVMPTYHPAYLLRNQAITEKRKLWEDMLQVLERLEHPISDKQRGYFLNG
ncbi:MAG: uracil-DNA glycosylase [Verrucomicrobiales bacterium]|nr:uracil-DNA glycosylase [Verrucomicrobiales bacterium]